MVDLDSLIEQCVLAVADPDPRLAVRDVLERSVTQLDGLIEALGAPTPGIDVLYRAPNLTVLNVVWPPGMSLFPHEHRMWAAISIYRGREDNAFYRRQGTRIVGSGGKVLGEGDVLLLGDDAIHSVANPARAYTGAIHVYGGDFVAEPRSQWDADTLEEEPYDMDVVQREFARAQQAYLTASE